MTGTNSPTVSVVMGVYNGAESLTPSVQSILSQAHCDFELIVVDDGSKDDSGRILDELSAQDARLRVIHQDNTGLTRALIRGCAAAAGEFIARQDCGDVSAPGRLAAQVYCLRSRKDAVAVTCHTQFLVPGGEPLYVSKQSEDQLNVGLDIQEGRQCRGPSHHGSVMMRRSAYEAVGGYRPEFYFAQDLDLWARMAELGRFAVLDEVLYQACLEPQSLSGMQSNEQRTLAELITRAGLARRAGQSEASVLGLASTIRPVARSGRAKRIAAGNYFIGCCLRRTNPGAAVEYFRQAVNQDPWHWKARARWLHARLAATW